MVLGGTFRGNRRVSRPVARLLTGATWSFWTGEIGLLGGSGGELTVNFLARSLFQHCILAAAHISFSILRKLLAGVVTCEILFMLFEKYLK